MPVLDKMNHPEDKGKKEVKTEKSAQTSFGLKHKHEFTNKRLYAPGGVFI